MVVYNPIELWTGHLPVWSDMISELCRPTETESHNIDVRKVVALCGRTSFFIFSSCWAAVNNQEPQNNLSELKSFCRVWINLHLLQKKAMKESHFREWWNFTINCGLGTVKPTIHVKYTIGSPQFRKKGLRQRNSDFFDHNNRRRRSFSKKGSIGSVHILHVKRMLSSIFYHITVDGPYQTFHRRIKTFLFLLVTFYGRDSCKTKPMINDLRISSLYTWDHIWIFLLLLVLLLHTHFKL